MYDTCFSRLIEEISEIDYCFSDACDFTREISEPIAVGERTLTTISIVVSAIFSRSNWYDKSEPLPAGCDPVHAPLDFTTFAVEAIAAAERVSKRKLYTNAHGYLTIANRFYRALLLKGLVRLDYASGTLTQDTR